MLGVSTNTECPYNPDAPPQIITASTMAVGAAATATTSPNITDCSGEKFVRRKSVPIRAPGRNDFAPGLLFRVDPRLATLTVISSSSVSASASIASSRSNIFGFSEEASDGSAGEATVTGLGGSNSAIGTWPRRRFSTSQADTRASRRNSDRNTGAKSSVGSHGHHAQRPRSLSLHETTNGALLAAEDSSSQTDSVDDHESGNEDYEAGQNQRNSNNSTARRPSISGAASTTTGYGGSLAHLVPNHFLQTTSRRISTHTSAPGCACTSCGSTVTPYWRDGWSPSVMLCNACGLRFQKFARRCPACMYIPRKEDSLGDLCINCDTPWVIGTG